MHPSTGGPRGILPPRRLPDGAAGSYVGRIPDDDDLHKATPRSAEVLSPLRDAPAHAYSRTSSAQPPPPPGPHRCPAPRPPFC